MPSPLALTSIYTIHAHSCNNAFNILHLQQYLQHLLCPRLLDIPTYNVYRMAYLCALLFHIVFLPEL